MSAVQRQLPMGQHEMEYLIHGRFHDNMDDSSRGYDTTAWTPLSMLTRCPELFEAIRRFVEEAHTAYVVAFGQNAPLVRLCMVPVVSASASVPQPSAGPFASTAQGPQPGPSASSARQPDESQSQPCEEEAEAQYTSERDYSTGQ